MNRTVPLWLLLTSSAVSFSIGAIAAFVAWHEFAAADASIAIKTDPIGYVATNVICQHDMDFVLTEPLDCSHGGRLR